jgi:hypothetical protein
MPAATWSTTITMMAMIFRVLLLRGFVLSSVMV